MVTFLSRWKIYGYASIKILVSVCFIFFYEKTSTSNYPTQSQAINETTKDKIENNMNDEIEQKKRIY